MLVYNSRVLYVTIYIIRCQYRSFRILICYIELQIDIGRSRIIILSLLLIFELTVFTAFESLRFGPLHYFPEL